jgi:hypothetical protein
MYTAKINRKDIVPQGIRVFVDFTDGATTLSESCIPQNEDGLKFWVKSRLETLNSIEPISTTYADGVEVDVSDKPQVEVVLTPEQIAEAKWLKQYTKWVKIKTTLIDTGILTGDETKVAALKAKVQEDYLPVYLDII